MGKICSICGKPSGMYPLCLECNKLKDKGKIIKCDVCGEWHYTDKPCSKCNPTTKRENKSSDSPNITCLICGEDSNGLHFCKNCYGKYVKKEILIKIVKCATPCAEVMSESYANEAIYVCEDGHIVKSHVEREIDNWLHKKHIMHGYEKDVYVGEEKPIKPDFCLTDYLGEGKDVYVEYFGLKGNKDYDKQTDYKIKKYKEHNITVICMYPSDDTNLGFSLQSKLDKNKIKMGEINFFKE